MDFTVLLNLEILVSLQNFKKWYSGKNKKHVQYTLSDIPRTEFKLTGYDYHWLSVAITQLLEPPNYYSNILPWNCLAASSTLVMLHVSISVCCVTLAHADLKF